jgi:uncharacterized protein (DUF305 family)
MPSNSRTRTTLRRSLATAAAVAITGLAGCSDNDTSNMPGMDHGSSSSPTAASSPTTGTPSAGPHNDADVMFAQMMIPHHQQAIEMSNMILAKSGVDPQVSDLATKIKTAQQPEIDTMTAWLQAWGESVTHHGMNHGNGGGMMTPEEMHLRDAVETFLDLRAANLAARANQELRASGETARKRDPSTLVKLTPTELQIAQLVSSGLSNKEVATQCWISPRTVAFHLSPRPASPPAASSPTST